MGNSGRRKAKGMIELHQFMKKNDENLDDFIRNRWWCFQSSSDHFFSLDLRLKAVKSDTFPPQGSLKLSTNFRDLPFA